MHRHDRRRRPAEAPYRANNPPSLAVVAADVKMRLPPLRRQPRKLERVAPGLAGRNDLRVGAIALADIQNARGDPLTAQEAMHLLKVDGDSSVPQRVVADQQDFHGSGLLPE